MPTASLDIIEGYAPGTKAKVLARTSSLAADLERDNPNLVGGDRLGGSHHLSQNFLFRPMPGWARLANAGEGPLHDRRIDLAGRGNGRRLGLHAGEDAGGLTSTQ